MIGRPSRGASSLAVCFVCSEPIQEEMAYYWGAGTVSWLSLLQRAHAVLVSSKAPSPLIFCCCLPHILQTSCVSLHM